MNFALVYLVQRFFYRIIEFLRHWYVKSGRMYSNWMIDKLGDLDYYLAWQITFKNLFQPLYKAYSLIAYFLGFVFRLGRLLVGGLIYVLIFFAAIGLYIIWLVAPIYILVYEVLGIR